MKHVRERTIQLHTIVLFFLVCTTLGCDLLPGSCGKTKQAPPVAEPVVSKEVQAAREEQKREDAGKEKPGKPAVKKMDAGPADAGSTDTGASDTASLVPTPPIPPGQYLTIETPAGAENGHFGEAAAVVGTTVFVSAPQVPGHGGSTGAVYVYKIEGMAVPRLVQTLRPTEEKTYFSFGQSIAAQGRSLLVVAAYSTGEKNYNKTVYAFRLSNGIWTQTQKIVPDNLKQEIYFGAEIALDDHWALIGAPGVGKKKGSAYVFSLTDGKWRQTHKLVPSEKEDSFGYSVSISGSSAIIGAPGWFDTGGTAYCYVKKVGKWIKSVVGGEWSMFFGKRVSLEANTAAISIPGDERIHGPGDVYVYERTSGEWKWTDVLSMPITEVGGTGGFGTDVAVKNDCIYVSVNYLDFDGRTSVYRKTNAKWKSVALLPHKSDNDEQFISILDHGMSLAVSSQIVVTSAYEIEAETERYFSRVRVHPAVNCR